jgi:hypothetical protein
MGEPPDPRFPLILNSDHPADEAFPADWLKRVRADGLVDGICGERLAIDCSI